MMEGEDVDAMNPTEGPSKDASDVDETDLEAMQGGAGQQDGSSACAKVHSIDGTDGDGSREMIR